MAEPHRCIFVLPDDLYQDVVGASKRDRRSMTEIARYGIRMYLEARAARQAGHVVAVIDQEDRLLKEFILPD